MGKRARAGRQILAAAAATAAKGKRPTPSGSGFPKEYKSLTPDGKRAWLIGADCDARISAGLLKHRDVEQQVVALDKAANRVRRMAPTPAVAEERERTGAAFPPPVDFALNAMRTADHVLSPLHEHRVLWPAAYLTSNAATYDVVVARDMELRRELCLGRRALEDDDDADHESAERARHDALDEMDARGERVIEHKLATEIEQHLKAQIDRYIDGQRRQAIDLARTGPRPWKPCAKCGTLDGPCPEGSTTPVRVDGLRYNWNGQLCKSCAASEGRGQRRRWEQ